MKVAVLDFVAPFEGGHEFVGEGELLVNWMERALPDAAYHVWKIAHDDRIPDLSSFDAFIVGGSDKGVYDDEPWMEPLRPFLLEARRIEKPLVGVCFGHQIMADTFGGTAEKSDKGNQVGVRSFVIDGSEQTAHVWHQDQVTKKPADAELIGTADYCPFAVLQYPFPALSMQFHPEFTRSAMLGLIDLVSGRALSPELAEEARASILAQSVAVDLMAERAAAVLSGKS